MIVGRGLATLTGVKEGMRMLVVGGVLVVEGCWEVDEKTDVVVAVAGVPGVAGKAGSTVFNDNNFLGKGSLTIKDLLRAGVSLLLIARFLAARFFGAAAFSAGASSNKPLASARSRSACSAISSFSRSLSSSVESGELADWASDTEASGVATLASGDDTFVVVASPEPRPRVAGGDVYTIL